jgi:vacuolar-type H+-ATPase subunit E/Vma4
MSAEKVEELVLQRARQEAEVVVAEAKERVAAHLAQAEGEMRRRGQEELGRFRRQLQEELDRELAARVAEHNQQLLVQRNRLLGAVRQRAEQAIGARPQPQYRNWLAQQLRQLGDVKQGELICRGDDRQTVQEVLGKLASAGVRLNLTLSSENLQASGGFRVRCSEYDVDVTLESQLQALWPDLARSVAARLFGQPGGAGG